MKMKSKKYKIELRTEEKENRYILLVKWETLEV